MCVYPCQCCAVQEGYKNEKLEFLTGSRQKLDSLAYVVSHSDWFYALSLGADLLLLALAIIERPAVPIPGFTPSLLVSQYLLVFHIYQCCLQCFDAFGWGQEGHPACKN